MRKYIRAFVLLLITGVATIFFLTIQRTQRPEKILMDLLPSHPTLPERWESSWQSVSVEWKSPKAYFSAPANNAFWSDSNIGKSWTNADTSIVVSHRIYHYPSPLRAMIQYYLSRPEVAYGNNWPNFAIRENRINRYPDAWVYQSHFADQELVVCAMGPPEECQIWFYWARYGQYLMQVRFFAPNRGISAELFAQIVAQFDPYVGEKLE
jgi:hypothetical protein